MCGRFTISDITGIEKRFQIEIEFPDLKPNYNVAPSQDVPVILNNGSNHLAMFRWGLIPYWAKDPSIGNKIDFGLLTQIYETPVISLLPNSFRVKIKEVFFEELNVIDFD